MNKYIDTDKIIAFLNKKMESYKSKMVDPYKYPVDHIDLMALLAREYQSLILKVASFQQEQPEVDFEEEWEKFEDWMESYDQSDYPTCYGPKQIARHFFELGLKAKEENK